MEENKKKKKLIIAICIIFVLIIILMGVGIALITYLNREKLVLYDNVVELGNENYIETLQKKDSIYIEEGYTYSVKNSAVDIYTVGVYDITFEIKGKGSVSEEIKQIEVQDTTPPTITLKQDTFYIGDTVNIEEIVEITDLSQEGVIPYNEANVQIDRQFDTSKEGVSAVNISVTDKNGNTTTDELKINVKNQYISLYGYILSQIITKKSVYSDGSYDNSFVLKFTDDFGNGLSAQGWINFTDKVYFEYIKFSSLYGTTRTADLIYFNDDLQIEKVYSSAGFSTGNLAIDSYLNKVPNGFREVTGDDLEIHKDTVMNEVNSLNKFLKNKDIFNIVGKTTEQLKNETIDIRELY